MSFSLIYLSDPKINLKECLGGDLRGVYLDNFGRRVEQSISLSRDLIQGVDGGDRSYFLKDSPSVLYLSKMIHCREAIVYAFRDILTLDAKLNRTGKCFGVADFLFPESKSSKVREGILEIFNRFSIVKDVTIVGKLSNKNSLFLLFEFNMHNIISLGVSYVDISALVAFIREPIWLKNDYSVASDEEIISKLLDKASYEKDFEDTLYWSPSFALWYLFYSRTNKTYQFWRPQSKANGPISFMDEYISKLPSIRFMKKYLKTLLPSIDLGQLENSLHSSPEDEVPDYIIEFVENLRKIEQGENL